MKNLLPNKDRLVMYKDGQEILPGIQAIYSPGHTVGHSSLLITSGGKSLCYTGDVALHEIMLRNPKIRRPVAVPDHQVGHKVEQRLLVLLPLAAPPLQDQERGGS